MSIEVDPRTVTPARLSNLRELGFNRISFGVQDFDPDVQQAVHRVQPFESVRDLMHSARALGYRSINADLIYGLPRQTAESFARTVQQIGELRPDRIALYAYAHLPERFKPQRRILAEQLPGSGAAGRHAGRRDRGISEPRLQLHRHGPLRAGRRLVVGGQAPGSPASQLPGLQHAAGLRPHRPGRVVHRPGRGRPTIRMPRHCPSTTTPCGRGSCRWRAASRRRATISCGAPSSWRSCARAGWSSRRSNSRTSCACAATSPANWRSLRPSSTRGWSSSSPTASASPRRGWYLVRAIAMVFDRHLQADRLRERFSRVI